LVQRHQPRISGFIRCDSAALALLFHDPVAVVDLAIALDGPACGAACHCAAHGGQLLARAATDLVAQQATDDRTGRGPGDAVRIPGVLLDLDVAADHARTVVETTP